ncbi:MAG: GNAT family N-acetyltransferase [Candidatus Hatepunaea meridiana]|nr:GNAT family N-acetyltransferase [Candidatus Hatepunaea meridiana]
MNTVIDLPTEIKHRIEIDSSPDPVEWEDFLPSAVNATIFHSQRFLAYHPLDRFKQHWIGFRQKGNLIGIFVGAELDESGEKVLVSHPGASYGGPAWSRKLRYHQLENLITSLVDYARDRGFKQIKMTPPPIIYNRDNDQSLDFALKRNGFNIIRNELTQAVRLDFDEAKLLDSFVNKTRTAYRKAVKEELVFRVITNPTAVEFDRFWEILVENRQGLGVVPAHSRHEIERLHNLIPDELMLAVIEHKGRIVTTIWNFICNKYTVLEFYMAHEASAQILRPVPFITYHTLLWAKKQGFKWLDFGISSIWGDPTWGLLKFKENFNARHFLRLTYQRVLQ